MAEADPGMAQAAAAAESARPKRRWGRMALMLSLPLLLAVGAFLYWSSLQGKVSTDNAYIQQDRVSVSAEVGGRIVEVLVGDGDRVAPGA